MKKHLILSILFLSIAFAQIFNAPVFSLSQSHDVTVGEVDRVENEQNVNTPDTGASGLRNGNEFAVATVAVALPLVIVLLFTIRHFRRK